MLFENFSVGRHNSHYEGGYSESELEWLRICAADKARNLQQLVGRHPVASVLEVGCGSGAVLSEVRRRGVGTQHVGVDMADPRAHLQPAAAGLDIHTYDGRTLPFADQSFDLVYATHVVEHVPDPRGFLAELRRVSKGLIYLEVPCELHMRATRDSLQRTLDIGHINAYTPEGFALLVQTAKLSIIASDLFDHSLDVVAFGGPRWKGQVKHALRSALYGLSRQWASRTFTYHFAVLCRPA